MAEFIPKPPPPGTLTPLEHEQAFLKNAEMLEERGRKLLERDGRVDAATGNQLFLAATKLRQAAAELALARMDRDHWEWRMAEWKRIRGYAEPARQRLRRNR